MATSDGSKPIRVRVLTVSDRAARGEREDRSGPALEDFLRSRGMIVVDRQVAPDGVESVAGVLRGMLETGDCELILTTGGSGLSPRDWTPEATARVGEREVPGLMELARSRCFEKTAFASLGRGVAVTRGRCLIINLPGNPNAAVETLEAMEDVLPHAISQITQEPHDCQITGQSSEPSS